MERKNVTMLFLLLISVCSPLFGDIQKNGHDNSYYKIVGTNISGEILSDSTLRKNLSPYYVNGDVTITNSKTLTIEPGVELIFKGAYSLIVNGRLLACGTQSDSVKFHSENSDIKWRGIRFDSTPATNDSSYIKYCSIRNSSGTISGQYTAGGGIYINGFSKVNVLYNLIENNSAKFGAGIYCSNGNPYIAYNYVKYNKSISSGAGIYLSSSDAVVTNNYIMYNSISNANYIYGAGIDCRDNSNAKIINNVIAYNILYNQWSADGCGINVFMCNPDITGNLITNNIITSAAFHTGGGINLHTSKAIITNNTILNNTAKKGGGVFIKYNSSPVIKNNIIRNNTAEYFGNQIAIDDGICAPTFYNNNIQNFEGSTTSSGVFVNNIDKDPQFVNAGVHIYQLGFSSPCVDAGVLDGINLPQRDLAGNLRISNSRVDIGAYETNPSSIFDELSVEKNCGLLTNYPNPFNPLTVISYQLAGAAYVKLTVFNAVGKLVQELINGRQNAGNHSLLFNGFDLNSGIYFCRLEAGGQILVNKMVLAK